MKQVNICVGRFQPFTKGHLRMPEAGMKENGLGCVICMVKNKKQDSRHPFTDDIIQKEMNIIIENEKSIIDTIYITSADIKQISEECHNKGYEPKLWITGSDRYQSYNSMINGISKKTGKSYKEMYSLDDDFSCLEVNRTDEDISATKVRNALKNDNKSIYDKMMPECVVNNDDMCLNPNKKF